MTPEPRNSNADPLGDMTDAELAAWIVYTEDGATTNGAIEPQRVHVDHWDENGEAAIMVPAGHGHYRDAARQSRGGPRTHRRARSRARRVRRDSRVWTPSPRCGLLATSVRFTAPLNSRTEGPVINLTPLSRSRPVLKQRSTGLVAFRSKLAKPAGDIRLTLEAVAWG